VTHARDAERWAVTVLGDPVFGVKAGDKRPIVTNDWAFRDSALLPLRGDHPESSDAHTGLISRSLDALRDVAPRVSLDFDKIAASFRPSEVH